MTTHHPATTMAPAIGSRWPALRRLIATEARLFLREPVGVIFVVAFPALTALVISGSFEPDDPAFRGVAPSAYYLAAYFGVVLAAVGLIMLPGHLATYRERGVLRRFDASPFPSWSLPLAWILVASGLSAVGILSLLVTVQAAFVVPAIVDPFGVVAVLAVSLFTFLNIGLWLGFVLRNARAAQGVGLLLFFPSFLLGGAGPPPEVMPSAMRSLSNLIPTTHVVRALQHSWLGVGGSSTGDLVVLLALGAAAAVAWLRVARHAA